MKQHNLFKRTNEPIEYERCLTLIDSLAASEGKSDGEFDSARYCATFQGLFVVTAFGLN